MRTLAFYVATTFLGGLTFWLPSIGVHFYRRANFSGPDVIVLTGVLPVFAIVAGLTAQRLRRAERDAPFMPLLVALGIWLVGPAAMFVSATATGGGFATENWLVPLLVLMALFPISTYAMGTYDGTLFAVLLGTFALCLLFLYRVMRQQSSTR
jgi:hypothetical protein